MEDRITNRQNNRRFDVERIIRQKEIDDTERRINCEIDLSEIGARNVRLLLMQQRADTLPLLHNASDSTQSYSSTVLYFAPFALSL